jgi:V/A-type H+-transporting ATPase subunit K
MKNAKKNFKMKFVMGFFMVTMVISMLFFVRLNGVFAQEQQATQTLTTSEAAAKAEVSKFALIAAALAFGLGALGAGIAVGNVGAAAMGAIGEKPEIFGQAIVFVGLAEGIMIFGFILAIMILGRV